LEALNSEILIVPLNKPQYLEVKASLKYFALCNNFWTYEMAGEGRGCQECSLPRAIIIVLTILFGHLIAAKHRE
jgi:hypothetical protein